MAMAMAISISIPGIPHSPPPPQSPFTANGARDASPPQSHLHSAFTTTAIMTPATTNIPNSPSPHMTSCVKDKNQNTPRTDSASSANFPPGLFHSRSATSTSISTTSMSTSTSTSSASRHSSISNVIPATTTMPASSSPIMTKPTDIPPPTIPRRALEIFGSRPFQFIFSRRRGRERTDEPSPCSPASRTQNQSPLSHSSSSDIPFSLPPSPIRRTAEPHPGTLVVFSKSGEAESAFEEEGQEGAVESWSSCSSSSSRGRSADIGAREEYHGALRAMSRPSETETAPPVNRELGFTSKAHRHSAPAAAPAYFHGSGHAASMDLPVYACSSSPSSSISSSSSSSSPLFSTSTSANANENRNGNANENPRAARKLHNIDYKERKLERRARSMEERDRVLREGIPVYKSRSCGDLTISMSMSTEDMIERENKRESDANGEVEVVEEGEDTSSRSSSSASSSDNTPSPTPRTSSSSSSTSSGTTSSPSITLFLSSIRASFSARQSPHPDPHVAPATPHAQSASYDIFVDEAERGFLGETQGEALAI